MATEVKNLRRWARALTALALLCASLGILIVPRGAMAANIYYVATTGNDANPGTQVSPWRTIQKAANTMAAGDTVVVAAGNYGERVQVSRSGAAGALINYQTSGTVSMKGFTVLANYVRISGFYITNTADDSRQGVGIWVRGNHCLIENNDVYYATRGGIQLSVDTTNAAVTTDDTVRNNRLERNSQWGIQVEGLNHLIEGNDISGSIQHHPSWISQPSWVDADGMRFFGSGHVIRQNYIHDITYKVPENVNPHIDCFQTWGDTSHAVGHDIVFDRNFCKELEATSDPYVNTHGFMLEGGANNLVVKNNIIFAYAVLLAHDSAGLQIVNNTVGNSLTFTQNYPQGIALWNSPNATVENNIFVDEGPTGEPYLELKDTTSQQGLSAGSNVVYMSDGRNPPGAPRLNDLWKVDPKFVDRANYNFHLLAGSPAIDSGVSLPQVADDYDGHPRPSGSRWDRGAFEATGQTATATPTATVIPTNTRTNTPTATRTPTNAPTATPVSSSTSMPTPGKTPTNTATPVTVVLPTRTPTATPRPTNTPSRKKPKIHGITPHEGPSSGGTVLTVLGEDFDPKALVTVGQKPCANARIVNASTIICTVPPGQPGAVAVAVTNPDGGTDVLPGGFIYGTGSRAGLTYLPLVRQ